MAVLAVEVHWKKIGKFLSAAVAAVLALPNLVLAQAQRISADWLQLTPSDPRAGIPAMDARTNITTTESATTISIERRTHSRRDSVAGATAYEASKRDQNLHVVVSRDDRRLYVVVGVGTVMQAPVAIRTGHAMVCGVWRAAGHSAAS